MQKSKGGGGGKFKVGADLLAIEDFLVNMTERLKRVSFESNSSET